MLISLIFQCLFFNIRYTLIFQIEKIFCPDFLLFRDNVLTTILSLYTPGVKYPKMFYAVKMK